MTSDSLFARLQQTDTVVEAPAPPETGDPGRIVDLLRSASRADDADVALAAWDEAGALHDPESLDEALGKLAPSLGVPFVTGVRRRRLRRSARDALRRTSAAGTLCLAAAVLGAVGERADAADLEVVAGQPGLTLHGATALANLRHWEGRASLLRVMARVTGDDRVTVIDRLLPHVREPAVRVALVRDAFTDLDDESARDIAPAVASALDLPSWLDDQRIAPELRDAARRIVSLATD